MAAVGCYIRFSLILTLMSYVTLSKTYADLRFEDIKEVICGVPDGNYDTGKLASQNYWSYDTTKTENTAKCLKSDPTANITTCELLFSFCHGYNCSDTDKSLMNTTACMTIQEKTNQTQSHTFKLGSYNSGRNQFASIPDAKGMKFLALFTDGGKYKNGSGQDCTLSMDVEFDCNQKEVWATTKEKKAAISPTALTKIDYDAGVCKYKLSFNYSGACPPKVEPGKPSEKLSFGSWLLIIFFVGLTIYFVFGSLLKYCFGSRGREIIPQSEFWTMLPVYVADGFIFTCTCGKAGGERDSKYDSI